MKKLQLDNNLIKSLYEEGFSTYQVAEKIGTHQSLIYRRLKEMKVGTREVRQDHFNEHYFDVINTRKKAYFLGLWYADGWNNIDDGVIGMELQEGDGYIMKDFLVDINSNRELKLLKAKKNTHQNKYSCLIYSKYMSQKLADLGCKSPKSLTLVFPSEKILPKEFQQDFMRGYFDGDGCIYIDKKNGKSVFSVVGTNDFISSYQNMLVENRGIKVTGILHQDKNPKGIVTNAHGSKQDVLNIRDYLYKDATIYLQRKYNKFFSLL